MPEGMFTANKVMDLSEEIAHCEELAKGDSPCAFEHRKWITELAEFRHIAKGALHEIGMAFCRGTYAGGRVRHRHV